MQVKVINQTSKTVKAEPYMDRASLFGDGFFTTGIIHNHQFCQQQRHFDRLIKSARQLLFDEFDISEIKEVISELVELFDDITIRISISRQQRQRGYAISADAESICHFILSDLPDVPVKTCDLVDATTAISCNSSLAGIKHLNRLDSVLAASEISHDSQEVLMYNSDRVICGSKSNLFVKLNDMWLTPKLDQCGITGITRDRTIEAFEKEEIECKITHITRSDMTKIDAAFVTNSLTGIWPAITVNGRSLNPEACEIIRKIVPRE